MLTDTLRRVTDQLRSSLADLDPERLSGPDASRLLDAFAEVERLAAAGKLLAARRVESSNVWRRAGHRSAAAHVAEATGHRARTGHHRARDRARTWAPFPPRTRPCAREALGDPAQGDRRRRHPPARSRAGPGGGGREAATERPQAALPPGEGGRPGLARVL